LAITSPTSGGRSVGIVRLRTQTMEFVFCFFFVVGTTMPSHFFKALRRKKDFSHPKALNSYYPYIDLSSISALLIAFCNYNFILYKTIDKNVVTLLIFFF
jgi:hypothetical protein